MSEEITKRGFTGFWLPREIVQEDSMSWQQRLLWAEIYALHNEAHGGCFASNTYLAEVLRTTEGTVSNALSKLREMGWIKDVSFDGRRRVLRAVFGPAHGTPVPKKKAKQQQLLEAEAAPDPAEAIYKAYPRRVGKPAALKAIRAALKRMTVDELRKRVDAFAKEKAGTDIRYIPYPAKWFATYLDDEPPTTTQPDLWN